MIETSPILELQGILIFLKCRNVLLSVKIVPIIQVAYRSNLILYLSRKLSRFPAFLLLKIEGVMKMSNPHFKITIVQRSKEIPEHPMGNRVSKVWSNRESGCRISKSQIKISAPFSHLPESMGWITHSKRILPVSRRAISSSLRQGTRMR